MLELFFWNLDEYLILIEFDAEFLVTLLTMLHFIHCDFHTVCLVLFLVFVVSLILVRVVV